jgi:hypothetical protein
LSHVKRAWREEALLIVEGQDGKQIRLHSPGRSSTSEPPRESLSSFFKATVGVNTEETLALYEWWERTETANIERFVESLGIQLEEKESSPS